MNKNLLIGGSLVALGVIGLFIKNSLDCKEHKKIEKEQFLAIMRKLKKENYVVLKQVAVLVSQLGGQFKSLTREMIQQYLESPESPLKVNDMIEANLAKVCEEQKVTVADFNANMEQYKNEPEVKKMRDEFDRDFQNALQGQIPRVNVRIPESLTQEKVLELQNKLTKKRYLLQIEKFRQIKGKTQEQLMANPDIFKGKSPQQQLAQILQEEGIGSAEQPAMAVYQAAANKYLTEGGFKNNFMKIQSNYAQIMNKYTQKMQKQTITQDELTELQDEIIFFQSM